MSQFKRKSHITVFLDQGKPSILEEACPEVLFGLSLAAFVFNLPDLAVDDWLLDEAAAATFDWDFEAFVDFRFLDTADVLVFLPLLLRPLPNKPNFFFTKLIS